MATMTRPKTRQLQRQAKEIIDHFEQPEVLMLAVKFLAFLEGQETEAATRELEQIPGFAESFERGMKDIEAGRLTPVEKLKRKYKRVPNRPQRRGAKAV